uniref:Squalene/phytoene synthase n=1 Tax=Meloidogyne incognita TaxID=6306 RepID=A0A914MYN2_MELIC
MFISSINKTIKTTQTTKTLKSSPQQYQEALNYCVKIVKERDYENYLAALLMPTNVRAKIFTILALNAEISTLRHKIKRHTGVANINQLKFWNDALNSLARRDALLPRQPVILALQAFYNFPQQSSTEFNLFLNLIKSRQQTLGDRPFENLNFLENYCKLLYGSLILLQMNCLNRQEFQLVDETKLEKVVNSLACSIGILTLLATTLLLKHDGIVLLPQDVTDLHGFNIDSAARSGPNAMKDVAKDLCKIASTHLNSARSLTCSIHPSLRPALLTVGFRSDWILKVLEKSDFNLLDVRLHRRQHPFAALILWWRYRRRIF